MMQPGETAEVYLCRDPVDLRKSIQGLSVLVEQTLGLDPFAARLYVFCGRRRDKIKILYWERSGFVLWYKRLEKGALRVARSRDDEWDARDHGPRAQLAARRHRCLPIAAACDASLRIGLVDRLFVV